MSERNRYDERWNDKLWDKTFTYNQDVGKDENLSRTARRKRDSHNTLITTILVIIIIVLAATPVIYWVSHQQSFDHPQQVKNVN